MPTTGPFDRLTDRYEAWFEDHEPVYESEVAAVERLLPAGGRRVEVGVGSGRFAAPAGIDLGVDPSRPMLDVARDRGVEVVQGVAEHLPFRDGRFEAVLLVTTICFVDDVWATLSEARRVLEPQGSLVVGFVDKTSPLGRAYQEMQDENPFYRDATFLSTDELVAAMEAVGFESFSFAQTVFRDPAATSEPDPVRDGYGDGSFVVVRGEVPAEG